MAKNNKTIDRIQAVWNILGGEEGVDRLIAGELEVTEVKRCWTKKDGIISLSVTPDRTTGPQWIDRLEEQEFYVGDYAKQVLHSDDFKPTDGVTYQVRIMKGNLFENANRITSKIVAEAQSRSFQKPESAELACLLRETLSDEDITAMGLSAVITMHEPIKDSDGLPRLLGADRYGDDSRLHAFWGRPGGEWDRDCGFAFVSQVGTES